MSQHFPMRLGRRSRPLLRLFGVRGVENAYVDVDAETLTARFGAALVRVPLANIARLADRRPVAVGHGHRDPDERPAPRRQLRRLTSRRCSAGLQGARRFGPFRIPALYVGVEDLVGLAAFLSAHGIEGVDARTDKSPVASV